MVFEQGADQDYGAFAALGRLATVANLADRPNPALAEPREATPGGRQESALSGTRLGNAHAPPRPRPAGRTGANPAPARNQGARRIGAPGPAIDPVLDRQPREVDIGPQPT